MVKTVEIKNFKSVKGLKIRPRRINLFIGSPNSGKSNILEAISIFSYQRTQNLKSLIRFQNSYELFFDQNIEETIAISLDKDSCTISSAQDTYLLNIHRGEAGKEAAAHFSINGSIFKDNTSDLPPCNVHYYKFVVREKEMFLSSKPGPLLPPDGANLPTVIITNKELRNFISELLKDFHIQLNVRQTENTIEVMKQTEDITISYPYLSLSDTLQRIIFYYAAMVSNRGAVLLFEEPESNSFPYYTKFLAERIGLDQRQNQYFISTHNPYFLISLIEKTPAAELAVFLTGMKNYRTEVKALARKEISEILDLGASAFFNLDALAGK